jgi:hypothetical protein
MGYSSASLKPLAANVNVIIVNVDDITTNIFTKIVYPTTVGNDLARYVIGSMHAIDTSGDFNYPAGYTSIPETWFDDVYSDIEEDIHNIFNNTLPIGYPE